MKRRTNIIVLALLAVSMLLTGGCIQPRKANKEECTAAVDHLIELAAEAEFGSGVVGRVAGKGAELYGNVSGKRQKVIRQCMGAAPVTRIHCVLRAGSMAQAQACLPTGSRRVARR